MGASSSARRAVAALVVAVLAAGAPAAAAPPAGPPAELSSPKIHPDLRRQLATTRVAEEAIVVLRDGLGAAEARQVAGEVGEDVGDGDVLHLVTAFRRSLSARQVERLAADPRVAALAPNRVVRASLDTARAWFGVDAAHAAGHRGGDAVASASTADAVIAIADSGIDSDTPELAGRVIAFVDCTSGSCVTAAPSDPDGHGTHVAGVAAGLGMNSTLRGVAPAAALAGIRVLDTDGTGSSFAVMAGIQWAVDHRASHSIDVLNLSFGAECTTDCDADPMALAVNAAHDRGLAVVVAAGNAGPERGSVEIPGTARGAITVGAMADVRPGDGEALNAGFRIAEFSGRGPGPGGRAKPDLVAAGVAVRAACSHDAPASDGGCPNGSTHSTVAQGTSVSTPFVSGTVALLRAANPTLTPAQLRSLLTSTAVPWGQDDSWDTGHQSFDYGAGRLDVAAAVAAAANPDPVAPAVPAHQHVTGTLSAAGTSACYEVAPASGLPMAATLLASAAGASADLDLELRSKSGTLLASSAGDSRQEDVAHSQPNGTYQLIVRLVSGSSAFDLDISNSGAPVKCQPRITGFSAVDAGTTGAPARLGFANEGVRVSFTVVNDAAAAWMVTESAVPPSASSPDWQPMSQTVWPAPADGFHLLHPWVKAPNGDVSPAADAEQHARGIRFDTQPPTTPTPTVPGGGHLRARETSTVTWPVVTDDNLGGNPISIDVLGAGPPITRGTVPNTGSATWLVPDVEIAAPQLRLTATDLAGNQASGADATPYIMGLGGYWADAFGGIHRSGGVPAVDETRRWGFRIGRGLAVLPGTSGGYLLDGFGGVHPFAVGSGSPPPRLAGGPYWNGWDIARDLVILPGGTGGYVLDGFGGLHRLGDAPPIAESSYFGYDIAKRLVLSPTGRGGYVLDGYGGTHPFRFAGQPAPPVRTAGPYWHGWDISRDLVLRPGSDGTQGYVLDGFGGLHPVAFGPTPPPAAAGGPWWNGWDIARGVEMLADGSGGYVHDGFGGVHGWRAGVAQPPPLAVTGYAGADVSVASSFR